MAKYDCDLVLCVSGKPDETFSCCCPDEACFLECRDALKESMNAIDEYRDSHPHDVACAAAGHHGTGVDLKITVKRDGKPHIGPTSFPIHDLPTAAANEMRRQWEKFVKTPCVAGCAKP